MSRVWLWLPCIASSLAACVRDAPPRSAASSSSSSSSSSASSASSASSGSSASPSAPSSPSSGAAMPDVRGGSLVAHIEYLAHDLLEGRAPGTRGHQLAEAYVAAQFAAAGARPAASARSYLQAVPLRRYDRIAGGGLAVHAPGRPLALAPGKDLVLGALGANGSKLRGPLVYAGFGIDVPSLQYSELGTTNLEGAIAIVFWGAPGNGVLPPLVGGIHAGNKVEHLVRKRPRAVIVVMSPPLLEAASIGVLDHFHQTRFDWIRDATSPPHVPVALVSMTALDRILAATGSRATARSLYDEAVAGRARAFALGVEATLQVAAKHTELHSANVIGMVEGTSPALAREAIIVTAHLDHLGIGAPKGGDAIYNGAIDDAAGVAILVELARHFVAHPTARTILFAAVTAEESGLVGSDYLARHPVAGKQVVANINLDPMGPLYPLHEIAALGADESSLGPHVRSAAAALGLRVVPPKDPVLFIRSDQYSFVKRGIPSVFPIPSPGDAKGDPTAGAAIAKAWHAERWHTPDDEWQPEWDARPLARFATFVGILVREAANASARPAWNADSYFRNFVAP